MDGGSVSSVGLNVGASDGEIEGAVEFSGLCDGIALREPGAGATRNTKSSTSEYGSPCQDRAQ